MYAFNYPQSPLVSPLHKSIKIEMYNYIYLQPTKVSVNRSRNYESSNQVDSEAFKFHKDEPKIPSMAELFQESVNYLPLFKDK